MYGHSRRTIQTYPFHFLDLQDPATRMLSGVDYQEKWVLSIEGDATAVDSHTQTKMFRDGPQPEGLVLKAPRI